MTDTYKLREVFSRGMPTVTYVNREHLGLERMLQTSVAKGHSIIAVTGPSKCGKTVLRRKVIPDNVVVKIEGGQVTTEDDFWERVRAHIGAVDSRSESAIKQTGQTAELNAQLGPAAFRIGGRYSDAEGASKTETRTYTGPQKGDLLSKLLSLGDVLVIDDFHYISKEVRASIVRAMKSAVFDGLSYIERSIPGF